MVRIHFPPAKSRANLEAPDGRGPMPPLRTVAARLLPVACTILLEQNDEWAVQRARYMTLETIAPLSEDLILTLPSNLISCSHWSFSGASSTSWVSCGGIHSGRPAWARRASGRAMPGGDCCAGACVSLRLGKLRWPAIAVGSQFR